MTRFLLIRHANSEANDKRLAGRMPGVRLDERGQRQARALAERLAHLPIAAVYASPLQRTVETAEPIARLLGREIVTCEDFLEIEFGEWTDRTLVELAQQPEFHRFNTFRSCTRVPGGELMLQAQARMIMGLEKLRVRHPQDTVAVIGHGDMIKAAIAHYAGIPLDLFQRIEISPASISAVDMDEESVRIAAVNDTGGASWGTPG